LLLQITSCRTFRDECKQSLAKAVPGMRNRPAHKEAMLVGVKEGKDRQEFFNVKLTDILTARTGKADQAVTYLPTSSA
jgi:hypothetical protein